jgi:hypothetical protein
MFDDPAIVGSSWNELADHLDAEGIVAAWAGLEPELVGLATTADLVGRWRGPGCSNDVLTALVRRAAIDGGRDDDALLVLLHLLSRLVWRLVGQLGDLSSDITAIVLAELTCEIRTYRWRTWRGSVVAALEKQTRRAVLADLRPSDRYHPDRVAIPTDVSPLTDARAAAGPDGSEWTETDDLDIVDLLLWAADHGADPDCLELLVASEQARSERSSGADDLVAQRRQIARRTVLRRRGRALATLRALAPAYLAHVA